MIMKENQWIFVCKRAAYRAIFFLIFFVFIFFGCGPKRVRTPELLSGLRENVVWTSLDLLGK